MKESIQLEMMMQVVVVAERFHTIQHNMCYYHLV